MMKKAIFVFLFVTYSLCHSFTLFSQSFKSTNGIPETEAFYYTFEPEEYHENPNDPEDNVHINAFEYIEFDSSGLWQIGQPQKADWDSAHMGNYVLMTDTQNLINHPTSASFIFKYERPWYSNCIMSWDLSMSDLYDLPTNKAGINIEVSYNQGEKWLELSEFSNDTLGDYYVTSGEKNTWGGYWILVGRSSVIDTEGAKITSVWLKFNYYNTDTVSHKGWMMDDLEIFIGHNCEFLSINNPNKANATLYPNPINGQSVLQFENSGQAEWQLNVYNMLGKLVFTEQTCNAYFLLQKNQFTPGSYVYRLTTNGNTMATGKFLVE